MRFLLDTDTCIGILRQRPGMVQRLSQLDPTDCAVSMVTVYELYCGLKGVSPRIVTLIHFSSGAAGFSRRLLMCRNRRPGRCFRRLTACVTRV